PWELELSARSPQADCHTSAAFPNETKLTETGTAVSVSGNQLPSCVIWLPRCGPGGLLRTRRPQTPLRLREWAPCRKECCGTSCARHKWRAWSRYPAPLPHLPRSSQRTRPSSASKLALQSAAICQFRRKCDGLPGLLPPILHR